MAPLALGRPLRSRQEVKRPPTVFIDGLSFLSSDLEEMRASGLSAFLLDCSKAEQLETRDGSIRFIRTFDTCLRSIVSVRRRLRTHPDGFLALRGSEIQDAYRTSRTAVFLQMQGCEPFESDLSRIDLFHELGLRVLQLTHHNDNPFAGGALEPRWTGLTELGRHGVEKLNELGILPDLSHASDPTARDVLEMSTGPVIVSHGAARAIVENARCTPDSIIRGIADSGGVFGVFMVSFWLTREPRPTVEALLAQIRHLVNVAGVDAVGIANDYTIRGQLDLAKLGNDNSRGVAGVLDWWKSVAREGVLGFDALPQHVVIPELNNVRRMFTIRRALRDSGFRPAHVAKIMGGNWRRVLTERLG